ncbi:MAG: type II CAAX endopeptidase family protein [Clostridiales bacterium]|nr:type II CAAX endopeptidase family protein [Clostridiales bacterium]
MEPLNMKKERKRISTMGWGLFFLLITSLLADLMFTWIAAIVDPILASDPVVANWLALISQYLIGFPVCMMIISSVPGDSMEMYRMRAGHWFRCFLVCCFLILAGNLLGLLVNDGLALLLNHQPANILDDVMGESSILYNMVGTVLLAPFFEEMVFRKMMIDRLNRLGDWPAMVVSALLFAMFHGNFYQFFYALGIGLLLGYIYVRTGRIRYTIFLHMSINFLFGVVSSVLNQYQNHPIVFALSAVYGLLTLLAMAAGIYFLMAEIRQRRLLRGWIELPGNRWGNIVFCNTGMIVTVLLCGAMFLSNILIS